MADDVNQLLLQVDASVELARRNLRGLEGEVQKFQRSVQSSLDKTDGNFDRFNSNVSRSLGQFKGLIAGAFTVGAVVQFGRSVVEISTKFRGYEQALKIVTGSTQAATAELEYVADVADRIGFKVTELTGAYVSLAAASRGTNLEGAKTRDIFESLVSASAAYGLTTEQLEGALLAVQQMISKGTVSAEELRGQLGERLPGAFQIAARSMGVTTSELDGLLKKGKVVAGDFLPKFVAQLRREIPAGTEAAGAGFARLANEWDNLLRTVGDAGLFDALAEGAGELAKVVREMSEDGSLRQVGQDLKFIIGVAADGIGALQQVASLLNAIANNPKRAGYDLPSVLDRALGTGGTKAKRGNLSIEQTLRTQLASDEALFPKLGKGSAVADAVAQRIDVAKAGLKAIEGQKVLELKTALDRVNSGVIKVSKEAKDKLEADLQSALDAYSGKKPKETSATTPSDDGAKKTKKPKQTALEKYSEKTDYSFERLQEINDFVESTKEIDLANVRIGKTISFTEYLAESFGEVADVVDRDVKLAFDDLIKQQEELQEAAEDFARTFAGAFEDALLSGDLDGALDGLLEDLARLVIRLTIIEPLAKSVAAALGGKSGGSGFLASVGTAFSSIFGRASGGPISANQPYMVGERGPELIVPRMSAHVIPNNRLGGGGFTVNVDARGSTDPAMVAAAAKRAVYEAAPAIIAASTKNTMDRANRRQLPRGMG